ncbi:MAG: hypothetical protein OQK35_04030 [Alphaproteobacteria bacterium]|nr:hypothetical protein [Alphaproteobacteria bacterium]
MDDEIASFDLESSLESSLKEADAEGVDLEDLLATLMKERMAELATLKPNATKEDLVSLLEKTFITTNGLLIDHATFRDLPNEMIKNVQFILQILVNCMDAHDKEFKIFIRTHTAEIQKNLDKAVKRRLPNLTPPETHNIQIPEGAALDAKKVHKFTDALSNYLWARMSPYFVYERKGDEPPPFFLSPNFSGQLIKGIHKHLLPWLLKQSDIQNIIQEIPSDNEDEYFRSKFQHQGNNPTKQNWERGFAKLSKEPEKKNPFSRLWEELTQPARQGDYQAPQKHDHRLYRYLFERHLGNVRKNIIGVQQVIEQEATGSGREGSTRDYLCHTARSLLHFDGDLISVWALYAYPNQFSETTQSAFFRSMGKTDQERRKYIPYFMRYGMKK